MIDQLKNKEKAVKRVLLITLFLNLTSALVKIAAGVQFHFLSLTSSGIESIFDGSSNLLGLIAITLAMKPRDSKHNYGHQKFETLGSLLISLLLFFSAFQLIMEYKDIILTGKQTQAQFSFIAVGSILISMCISLFVSIYEKREGEKYQSSILIADSEHTFGDLIVSFGVLFSLIMSYYGYLLPDMIVGTIVIFYLIYLGVKIARSNLDELLDSSPIDSKNFIEEILKNPKVKDVHKFRSRGNSSLILVDFHLLLDSSLSLVEAHKVSHDIEDLVRDKILAHCNDVDITIHFEPYEDNHHD